MSNSKLTFLVDDQKVCTMINKIILTNMAFSEQIVSFNSATAALEVLKNIPTSIPFPPDIIFLDIRMPVMDGHGFLKEFDKLPESIRNYTKIIMLTSSLNESDKQKTIHYDFVIGFLNKPLKESQLKSILSF